MDAPHFDALTRLLGGARSRRGLFGLLAALPLFGALAGLLAPEDSAGKDRRRRRKARNRRRRDPGQRKSAGHRKRKRSCVPESLTETCTGKCGTVPNSCQTPADCGKCPCVPLTACPANACGSIDNGCGGSLACGDCPACQTCANHTCIPDTSQDRSCCAGDEGQRWCQAGECVPIPADARATLEECEARCDCENIGCGVYPTSSTTICGAERRCILCEDCTEAPLNCAGAGWASFGPAHVGSFYCYASSTPLGTCEVVGICPDDQVCLNRAVCLTACFGNAE